MAKIRIRSSQTQANLADYAATCASFGWEQVAAEFTWGASGRLNLAQEAVDRWAADQATADQPALILRRGRQAVTLSYARLAEESRRWAAGLAAAGIGRGDLVLYHAPAQPETYYLLLACARRGAVFCWLPPYTPAHLVPGMVESAGPRLLVTHPGQTPATAWDRLPPGCGILWLEAPEPGQPAGWLPADLLPDHAPQDEPVWLEPDAPLLVHFTTGGSRRPRPLVFRHRAMSGWLVSARWVLDLGRFSVVWADGEPWGLQSLIYSVLGPWLLGACGLVVADPFSPTAWLDALGEHLVTVWYTSHAVFRGLRDAWGGLDQDLDLYRLRHIASLGEALPYELFFWVRNNLGLPPHDTWWSPECGLIALANFPSLDLKLGSSGRPLPGLRAKVADEFGRRRSLLVEGRLFLSGGQPSMAAGAWGGAGASCALLAPGGWLPSRQLALTDEEGCYYLQGRTDEVIGCRDRHTGPWEVEQAVLGHPAVARAGAIAKADLDGSAGFKVYVELKPGAGDYDGLARELLNHARGRLYPTTPLKEVEVIADLPLTADGRLVRRALKALDLGIPTGQASHLAADAV